MIITDNISINNVSEIASTTRKAQSISMAVENRAGEMAYDQYIPTLVAASNEAMPSTNYNADGIMEDDVVPVSALVSDNKTGMDSAYMNAMTGDSTKQDYQIEEDKNELVTDASNVFSDEIRRELNIL